MGQRHRERVQTVPQQVDDFFGTGCAGAVDYQQIVSDGDERVGLLVLSESARQQSGVNIVLNLTFFLAENFPGLPMLYFCDLFFSLLSHHIGRQQSILFLCAYHNEITNDVSKHGRNVFVL